MNTPADALSRSIGEDIPKDSQEVALLPPALFLNVFKVGSDRSLEHQIVLAQRAMSKEMDAWIKHLPIRQDDQIDRPIWRHDVSG